MSLIPFAPFTDFSAVAALLCRGALADTATQRRGYSHLHPFHPRYPRLKEFALRMIDLVRDLLRR